MSAKAFGVNVALKSPSLTLSADCMQSFCAAAVICPLNQFKCPDKTADDEEQLYVWLIT